MPLRPEKTSAFKRLDRMLNDPKSTSKKRFDLGTAVLVVMSTSIVFLGGVSPDQVGTNLPGWLAILDNLILALFFFEYLARVAFAKPDLPEVVNLSPFRWWTYQIQSRIRWMLTPMALIDLLAFLPLFALDQAAGNFKLFRVLRILRLLRLYRLVTVYNPLEKLGKAFRSNSLLYAIAFSLVGIVIVMGSLSFYIVEGRANANVANPFDAIWWTVVTLTTVGYGDTVPATLLGRMVGIALMLAGVVLMAVFTGVMSQTMVGYLLDVREERVRMSSTVNHFIICGWNDRGPMVAEELRHLAPDEEIIVFADQAEPLDLPETVTYLRGNPTKESEWEKVRLSMAKNVLVLAPPTAGGNTTSDGYTALVVYTIRSFENKLKKKGIDRCVPLHVSAELLDPENYQHIEVAGADEVVHTSQIGSNLIAHSAVKPGMSKVVTELISWWGQGIDLEPFPEDLKDGSSFKEVSTLVREASGFLVVGVVNLKGEISLNPPDPQPLNKSDSLVVIRNHAGGQS